MKRKKKLILILSTIFLLALIIRIIHFLLIKNSPLFLNPILDAKQYDDWAGEILDKDWLSRSFDFMSPAYPYFLSVIYFIFGHSIPAVAMMQFLIGSVNCSLIYILVKKVFSISGFESHNKFQKFILSGKSIDFIGIVAAAISVCYGISIFYEGLLLKVALINFCNLMLLLLLIQGLEKKSAKHYFFAGLFLGLSAYLRPNILLFVPFMLLWFILSSIPFRIKHLVSFTAWLFFGYLIIFIPFAIRNYTINNEIVLTSGHGGINFYFGNNPESRGIYEAQYFYIPDTKYEHEGFVIEASRRTGQKLTTMQASRYWYGQSFDFIISHPLQWSGLLIKKFFIFWNAYEVPLNGLEYNMCKDYFPLLKAPFINFGIIAPFALLGMILLFNKNEKINLLLFYTFMYLLGAVVYYNSSEYRFPVVLALFIFASYAVCWIVIKVKQKNTGRLAFAMVGLIPFVILVNNRIFKIDDNSNNGTLYNNIGTIYASAGDYDNAIGHYEKAVNAYPEGIEFRDNLAHALLLNGMPDKAIDEYNKTLEIMKPHLSDAELNNTGTTMSQSSLPYVFFISKIRLKLGEIYIQTKQFEKAKENFIELLKFDPASVYALNDLGIVYFNMHDYDAAKTYFEKALKIKPGFIPALNNLEKINKQIINKQK